MIRQWLTARQLRRERQWAADRPRLDALYAQRIARIEGMHR